MRRARGSRWIGCALASTLAAATASAQHTERESVDAAGVEGNGTSVCVGPALSDDGHFVVFGSFASNLVPSDTNGVFDVFVRDRVTGAIERASVDAAGVEADAASSLPISITPDGRFVVFASNATNLVPGDTNGAPDVFVRDRWTGAIERVSVDSAGGQSKGGASKLGSGGPALSADGRFVAFTSFGDDLVAGDSNATADVFVHDRQTGVTERVSVDSTGGQADFVSLQAALSADGGLVAFTSSATNLVAGDVNAAWDVFVHDRTTGITERVSVDTSGAEGDDDSYRPSLSADGSIVLFTSVATTLVAGDTNGAVDVFVRDRAAAITARMSVDSNGVQGSNDSRGGSISGSGREIAFESWATNLVAGDANGVCDIFLHVDYSPATSSNYGSGVAGTFGVPGLTSDLPILGATMSACCENSLHAPTVGILFLGLQRAQLHTSLGGDLLLLPALGVAITFSYGIDTSTGTLPDDDRLYGVAVDLQVLEADPGAVKGVSFTQGLELVLGK